jgi:hypothetical protein
MMAGDFERALLRLGQVRYGDDRHFEHSNLDGAAQPGISGNNATAFVGQDGHQEAKCADAPADLLELPIAVLSQTTGFAPQRARGNPVDEQVRSEISEHESPSFRTPGAGALRRRSLTVRMRLARLT